MDGQYLSQVMIDADELGRIVAADPRTPQLRIVLMATHVDLDPRYAPEYPGTYWDMAVSDLHPIIERFGGPGHVEVTFGVCDEKQRTELNATLSRIINLLAGNWDRAR